MLYLIPNFLAETTYSKVFPEYNRYVLLKCNHFAVENPRVARSFLKCILETPSFDEYQFYTIGKKSSPDDFTMCQNALIRGENVALISDAGMPCVADPGMEITRFAHNNNIPLQVLIGPSSIFLALSASGLSGQNFEFHGYLPIDSNQLVKKLNQLEIQSSESLGKTQIFIETPYRTNKMFEYLLKQLSKSVYLCIASNLTAENEFVQTKTIEEWRSSKIVLNKNPTTFLFSSY